jgi:hypothetical protein
MEIDWLNAAGLLVASIGAVGMYFYPPAITKPI